MWIKISNKKKTLQLSGAMMQPENTCSCSFSSWPTSLQCAHCTDMMTAWALWSSTFSFVSWTSSTSGCPALSDVHSSTRRLCRSLSLRNHVCSLILLRISNALQLLQVSGVFWSCWSLLVVCAVVFEEAVPVAPNVFVASAVAFVAAHSFFADARSSTHVSSNDSVLAPQPYCV